MDLKQLNSVSPLRVFEDSINGGLGKGNLGVIVSKKGVGKTACLVHIATDKLFKGEYVPKFEFIEAEYLTDETADELLPKYKELFERVKDEEFFEKYKAKSFIGE